MTGSAKGACATGVISSEQLLLQRRRFVQCGWRCICAGHARRGVRAARLVACDAANHTLLCHADADRGRVLTLFC